MDAPRLMFRIVLSIVMTAIVIGLLIWQESRYQLVSECRESGGQWDAGRCRPVPKIFIERGLKRT